MDSINPCNRGKILSNDDMNFLKAGDSRDSSCFTNNIISHSFWNRGGTHVTACCTQCVLMKQISTCDTHDLTDQLLSLVPVVFRTGICCLPEKRHRSTDDKHQSRIMVTIGDEGQIRTCSYSVKSLRVQGIPSDLGFIFPANFSRNIGLTLIIKTLHTLLSFVHLGFNVLQGDDYLPVIKQINLSISTIQE